MEDVTRKNNY